MTITCSMYRCPCPIWGNEMVVARNAGGNLMYCCQAIVEIGQGFTYSL
jgi:hypothetical protein